MSPLSDFPTGLTGERVAYRGSLPSVDLRLRDLAGKEVPCLSVETYLVAGAPGDELFRVDYDPNDDVTLCLEAALTFMGSVLPLLVGRGGQVSIVHDLKNAAVILALVPIHGDGAGGLLTHDFVSIGSFAPSDVAHPAAQIPRRAPRVALSSGGAA